MSYQDASDFAHDPAVPGPISAAIVKAANDITNEDPTVADHVARAQLAYLVLRNPMGMSEAFVWSISTNATIVGKWKMADPSWLEDLDFVLGSLWNSMAGVYTT